MSWRASAAETSAGKRGIAVATHPATVPTTIRAAMLRSMGARYQVCCRRVPVFRLDERLVFPPVELADEGLLAVGGDLRPERLLLAYSQGIFPWYGKNLPILWHSPDPRMVLLPGELVVGRSLKKAIRRKPYELRLDTAFGEVLRGCADVPRPGQNGTWLIPDMVGAY